MKPSHDYDYFQYTGNEKEFKRLKKSIDILLDIDDMQIFELDLKKKYSEAEVDDIIKNTKGENNSRHKLKGILKHIEDEFLTDDYDIQNHPLYMDRKDMFI